MGNQFVELHKKSAPEDTSSLEALQRMKASFLQKQGQEENAPSLSQSASVTPEQAPGSRASLSAAMVNFERVRLFTYPYNHPGKEDPQYDSYRSALAEVLADDRLRLEPSPAERRLSAVIAEFNFPGESPLSQRLQELAARDILNGTYEDQITAAEKKELSTEIAARLFPGDPKNPVVAAVREAWVKLCLDPAGETTEYENAFARYQGNPKEVKEQ